MNVRNAGIPNMHLREFFLALLCLGASNCWAAPLFEDNSVLEVTLTGPFGSLLDSLEDRAELPFVLEAQGIRHEIEVRVRGNSRLRVCNFPPLRLNFRGELTKQTVFEGQNKLKLVTHCRNYDRGEQDMLEEFAAYRIMNVLSDNSYRVRLLRINYRDTDGKLSDKAALRYGFLLEDDSQLATRIGAQAAVLEGVPKKRHHVDQAALVYVYQYLIANTDWGLVKADYDKGCCHNIDLFELDGRVLVVPFDFDLAGLVNARYAFPDKLLRIRKVTQRLYRGLCTDRELLRAAIRRVRDSESEILATVRETPGLSKDNAEKATRFLGAFFRAAENEDKLISKFERRCIG